MCSVGIDVSDRIIKQLAAVCYPCSITSLAATVVREQATEETTRPENAPPYFPVDKWVRYSASLQKGSTKPVRLGESERPTGPSFRVVHSGPNKISSRRGLLWLAYNFTKSYFH